jgi:hypothetical protein
VRCHVAETETVEGVQAAETEVIVGEAGVVPLAVDSPPQAATESRTKQEGRAQGSTASEISNGQNLRGSHCWLLDRTSELAMGFKS